MVCTKDNSVHKAQCTIVCTMVCTNYNTVHKAQCTIVCTMQESTMVPSQPRVSWPINKGSPHPLPASRKSEHVIPSKSHSPPVGAHNWLSSNMFQKERNLSRKKGKTNHFSAAAPREIEVVQNFQTNVNSMKFYSSSRLQMNKAPLRAFSDDHCQQ